MKFNKLALTFRHFGYEKSALLPYPSQAHHKPQITMERHTLGVYSKCDLVYCSFSFVEVVIRDGI